MAVSTTTSSTTLTSGAYRRFLRSYLRADTRRVAALSLLLVVSQAVPLAGPLILRKFVDQASAGARLSTLVAIAIAYLAIALATQALAVVVTWAGTALAWRITDRMRSDLARHVLNLDFGWLSRRSPGELIERVDDDITSMSEFYSQVALNVAAGLLLLAGVVVIVWLQDWRAGLVLTAFSAVAIAVVRRLQDHAVPATTIDREINAEVFGAIEERLAGVEDLRANGGGAHALNRFQIISAASYRARNRAELDGGVAVTTTHFTFAAGTAAILAVGVWLHRSGAITLGTVFLLFQAMQLVRTSLERIAEQLRNFQKVGGGATRVVQLFEHRPTIVDGSGEQLPAGPLDLRFDGVTFSYDDGPPALADVSFTVPAGRILGVVGRTGSGKTTLARLVARLYDPTAGRVLAGGVDLRELRLGDVRQRIAVVTQDVQLFHATVRDNLSLFGAVDDTDALDAIEQVELGEWFHRLPAGLDSVIGDGGVGLSAGEAQLLAFARAFITDAGLIVLDEPSSRLDPGTEQRIDRAVTRLLQGRTAVLVAHRLTTLERADDVLTLEGGRVVGRP